MLTYITLFLLTSFIICDYEYNWIQTRTLDSDETVNLLVCVKLQNLERLEAEWTERTSLDSPKWHERWLSRDEVDDMVRPTESDVARVLDWVSKHGATVKSVAAKGAYVFVEAPAAKAAQMVGCTQFSQYRHKKSTHVAINRCVDELRLDASLPIDYVGGVNSFPRVPQPHTAINENNQILSDTQKREFDLVIDPRAVKNQYMAHFSAKGTNTSQSVVQFLGQYANNVDLDEFFTLFWQPGLEYPKVKWVGKDSGWGRAGIEASLDLEYVSAMGANVPTTFWSNSGQNSGQEPFLDWMIEVGKQSRENVPDIFSVSYGDTEDSLDSAYLDRVNVEFMKQGLRGISIMFASGDSGVGEKPGPSGGQCVFGPDFPASSPYVTSVGATELADVVSGPEQVASLSGGGFSNVFPRPVWQKNAVDAYLKAAGSKLPPSTMWNKTGRAYPDIGAFGENVIVVVNGIPTPGIAGTSCASPISAGIFALINDQRVNAGKKVLGPLNQHIYKFGPLGMFTTLTAGTNPGCNGLGFPPAQTQGGFSPTVGFGSPLFPKMVKYLVQELP